MISIEHYIEVLKFHEEKRVSTDIRNKFWRELKNELDKKPVKGENESRRCCVDGTWGISSVHGTTSQNCSRCCNCVWRMDSMEGRINGSS